MGGIFAGEQQRLLVLGMLLELLGIDKVVRFGKLADWKAAIEDLKTQLPNQTAITSDQALHIARLDAEKAYGDLTPYRVSLVLEDDGWHVDYELKDPSWNGGAPHYLIDPTSGAILEKRYDQ
ncbi:MAG: PepSY domain-containing protein [Gemmataceae bacterium]